MIIWIAALCLQLDPSCSAPPPAPGIFISDEEFDKRLAAAGKDVDKLWELHVWCVSTERNKESASVLRKILRYDPDHRQAHEGLGHVQYADQWFTTAEKLAEYKKAEEARLAREKGWVQWKGEWVDPRDLGPLQRGMVRDPEGGKWMTPEDLAHKQAGWIQQDLIWVSPEEAVNIDRGLYKCGDRWLEAAKADRYHSQLGQWWRIPRGSLVLWTTLNRGTAELALNEMETALRDAERILGSLPPEPIAVAMLRDSGQYEAFCNGELGSVPDTRRFSRFRDAFLADSWLESSTGSLMAVGVGFWDDSTEAGKKLGPHAARLACGLSLVEAIDPSPHAQEELRKMRKPSVDAGFVERYFGEKRVRTWYAWGAATYLERFYVDPFVAHDGNPFWVREWSIGNIRRLGGLDPMSSVLGMTLSVETKEDTDQSAKWIAESGLLVAFIVDGKVPELEERHSELKQALRGEGDIALAFQALEEALGRHRDELKSFAKL